MMYYDIRHITRFGYVEPVTFARCNLRLEPIAWPGQALHAYELGVEPGGRTSPARAEAGLGNVVRLVVEQPTDRLTITSRCRVAFDPAATLVDTPPHEAFAKRHGVCQDFAQIMISGLRAAGLPAAYASG